MILFCVVSVFFVSFFSVVDGEDRFFFNLIDVGDI